MTTDTKAKSAAERKRLERQRKREAGLKKIEIWTKPDHEEKIRKYAEKLNK